MQALAITIYVQVVTGAVALLAPFEVGAVAGALLVLFSELVRCAVPPLEPFCGVDAVAGAVMPPALFCDPV